MLSANHKWKSSLNFHSRTAPRDSKKHRKSQILRTCSAGREFVHAEGEPWRKCGIFVSRHPDHVRGANWNSCFARRHLSWPFCGWSLDLISLGLYRSALAIHAFYWSCTNTGSGYYRGVETDIETIAPSTPIIYR